MPEPLILTLSLDSASQQHFDALRDAHFPADRLVVGAHLTMFHAIPGALEDELRLLLARCAEREPFGLTVRPPRLLGGGVAYDLASVEAARLRDDVRGALAGRLTRQDAQGWRPHVTVQNKVGREVAAALHARLLADFRPWPVTATGLALWRYLGGPWEPVAAWGFSRQA